MTKIPLRENDLFIWIKDNYIEDLEQCKMQSSRYDCFSSKYKLDIELKCRRSHYDDLIIEKKKYDALMKRARDFNTIPVYVNSTPVGIWAFYLSDIRIIWSFKHLPKQTDFSDNRFIQKEIGYLNIKYGVNLTK